MRQSILTFIVAVSVVLSVALPGTAYASAPNNFCEGKAEQTVVKTYSRGSLVTPLRCGKASYGFDHMVGYGRWNDQYDSQIAETIARGEESRDKTIYATFGPGCKELFRVIVNQGPTRGNEFRPQGVITAYYTTKTQAIMKPNSTANDVGDCPIIEGIAEPGR